MTFRNILLIAILFLLPGLSIAQTYDIILKGGHVIDPKNKIDAVMDLAIKDKKIALVAKTIDEKEGKRVVNVKGMYVTPGIIDAHVHVYYGNNMDQGLMDGPSSVQADAFSFRSGVTTMVDVGSSGYRTFPKFKETSIDGSQTRILALINIAGEGMRGGPFEQTTKDMIPLRAVEVAKKYPEIVVGFKLAHYSGHEWGPTDSVVAAGKMANLPVMIDFGGAEPPLPLEELFMKHLRPGDIFTHQYAYFPNTRDAVIDENGKVKPFVFEAVKRGIKFDVGHGGGSFRWKVAVPAIQQGFLPDAISTDLHTGSMNGGMKDMANTMSKFLALGLSLQEVINRSTWQPAQMINRPALGNLSVGTEADVAVFSISKGDYGFIDIGTDKLKGTRKMVAELTIRAGRIVWDLNGLAAIEFKK
ncbi:MAG: dihydroorotase [Bacteroidetes bacterium GWE2_41_25]|nr:MAG: dihydroorotase [Bacteroidetes bacterium GWA2_40_15]OFX92734.1 MAG: dihydroorotase [Bacteroidetes bacterium GWE2_41_25]HBQ83854.1 amidohydrolase/deacetylase family metallohydrolase [Bacteroidales bacterium]HCU19227.1 amidohydrolase/deacetylase family metallohydrolase [Bacteroidales bacterium]